jgi:hypothetical protein
MINKIYLTPKDLRKMADTVEAFEIQGAFRVLSDTSSGIGAVITMQFEQEMHGRPVTVSVEIAGVEDW